MAVARIAPLAAPVVAAPAAQGVPVGWWRCRGSAQKRSVQ